ncbi:MAG: tetratricopeptide repeat protein [Desulfoprunum sp.]|uniref:tetratricopeptide repeat protein n=1 Tax=Desulfoprunum sp. TaxID=2020866 RepID=UPI00068F5554
MTGPPPMAADLVDGIYRNAASLQQQGRYAEAEAQYSRLLDYFPGSAALHYNIGLLLYAQEKFEASLEHYLRAMDDAGDDPDLLYNLGLCLQKCGRTGNAALVYEELTRLVPDDVDGLYSLAGCHRELHEYDRAAEVLGRLLVLEPDHQAATGSLAYLLHLQGKLDEACACYLRLLELHPGHQTARHMVAALRGERLGTAADEYVRTVFNGYADGFDDSLVQGLGYRVPEGLRRGVGLLAGADRTFAHLLDLGCGTGLVGAAFADICRCLTGVDLAEAMIIRTRSKQLYQHLLVDGIIPFLGATDGRYDLVTLADVLIYLGDPEPMLAAVHRKTTDDALLCFSIETAETPTYRLQSTGRFAHCPDFIGRLAAGTGWTVRHREVVQLRREGDDWIGGMLFFLDKDSGGH